MERPKMRIEQLQKPRRYQQLLAGQDAVEGYEPEALKKLPVVKRASASATTGLCRPSPRAPEVAREALNPPLAFIALEPLVVALEPKTFLALLPERFRVASGNRWLRSPRLASPPANVS